MKISKKWRFGLAAGVLLGMLLTGCDSGSKEQTQYVEGLDRLGAIRVISREAGSGTRSTFALLAGFDQGSGGASGNEETDLTREDAQIANNTEEVVDAVEKDSASIGYISLGALEDKDDIRLLKVDGKAADTEEKQYPLSRSFYLTYNGKLREVEQDFLTYIHSAGQEIVGQSYVPVARSNTFLSNKAKGKIRIQGSTSVAPLLEELATEYQKLNKNADIKIIATDSTDGLNQVMAGKCDFGMSSRDLKDYEEELLDYEVIARDYIAVIVSKENPLENISLDTLKNIYTGNISDWAELNQQAEKSAE